MSGFQASWSNQYPHKENSKHNLQRYLGTSIPKILGVPRTMYNPIQPSSKRFDSPTSLDYNLHRTPQIRLQWSTHNHQSRAGLANGAHLALRQVVSMLVMMLTYSALENLNATGCSYVTSFTSSLLVFTTAVISSSLILIWQAEYSAGGFTMASIGMGSACSVSIAAWISCLMLTSLSLSGVTAIKVIPASNRR